MISFTCTPPPSTNQLFANVPGKGRVRTAKYDSWSQTAGWEIKAQIGGQTLPGQFILYIWLPPGPDLDNCCKAIADLLGPKKHGLGVTVDDKHMRELHVYRAPHEEKCRVRIEDVSR